MNRTKPKFDVEYTFRFRKENQTYHVTLIYEGINEKNRYLFFNKKTKAYTSMPERRFSYLHRFNLVEERPIKRDENATKKEQKTAQKVIPEEKEILSPEEMDKEIKIQLAKFRGLTMAQRTVAQMALKRPFSEFLRDVEKFLLTKDETIERELQSKGIIGELLEVNDALGFRLAF